MLQRQHSSYELMLSNKNPAEGEARQRQHPCLHQLLQVTYFLPVLQQKGWNEKMGGHSATVWGQLTTNKKFLDRNGREDFQRSSLLFPSLSGGRQIAPP